MNQSLLNFAAFCEDAPRRATVAAEQVSYRHSWFWVTNERFNPRIESGGRGGGLPHQPHQGIRATRLVPTIARVAICWGALMGEATSIDRVARRQIFKV
jgi:hypothetical protein